MAMPSILYILHYVINMFIFLILGYREVGTLVHH